MNEEQNLNKSQNSALNISDVSGSAFTINPPNVILDCGSAKIVFNKKEINIDDMLDVYIKYKNYLNTFYGVYL